MTRPPVRVVIPTWTVDESKGGIKTFLTGMVAAMSARSDVELTLLCTRRNRSLFEEHANRSRIVTIDHRSVSSPRLRPLGEQFFGGERWREWGDVAVIPSNVPLRRCPLPQIVVVQAPLAVRRIRHQHRNIVHVPWLKRMYYRLVFDRGLRRADAVVAVSEWLASELVESTPGLDPSRVHVVLEGTHAPPSDLVPSRRDPPTILFVSTLFTYKGAEELIDALGALRDGWPELEWQCRFVGRDPDGGRRIAALQRRADDVGVVERVMFVGARPHDEVWGEYARADVFVYPSRVETFGLPPLEAMSIGVPVVTSTAGSVVSVLGDAAMSVDVTDSPAFARAIERCMNHAPTRERLRRMGRRRAEQLDWDETAAGLARVIDCVASEARLGSGTGAGTRPVDRREG